jgi:hypothetical protein
MAVRERGPRRTARRRGMREAWRRHLVPTTEAGAMSPDTVAVPNKGVGRDAYEGSGFSWSR